MTAMGFIDAWTEAKGDQEMPILIGINGQKSAFAAIQSDKMYATIIQSPIEDGIVAINTMADIMGGKDVDARVPIPLTLVTSENVNDVDPAF